jgi:hypothetical protein
LKREKTLQHLIRSRSVTVSADTVKPTYILNGTNARNTTLNPAVDTTVRSTNYTLRLPGPFSRSIQHLSGLGGGCGSLPQCISRPTTNFWSASRVKYVLTNLRGPQQRQRPLDWAPLATADKADKDADNIALVSPARSCLGICSRNPSD